MKSLFVALAILAISTLPAMAQHSQHDGRQDSAQRPGVSVTGRGMIGMMEGEGMMVMMETMMKDPIHRAELLVQVLPTLRESLNLSNEQVDRLGALQAEFAGDQQARRANLEMIRADLSELLASNNPNRQRVETLLVERATERAGMQALALDRAFQMNDVLTAAQRRDLEEMTVKELHRAAMRNAPTMDVTGTHGSMMQDCMIGQEKTGRDSPERRGGNSHLRPPGRS